MQVRSINRSLWHIVVTIGVLLLVSRTCFAYGEDVHFNLTYVLCRLAGLPKEDALWIADANQSMDDNSCTTAFKNLAWWTSNQDLAKHNGIFWHNLSDVALVSGSDIAPPNGKNAQYSDGGIRARLSIRLRLDQLWANVPLAKQDGNKRILADIALGQYLHTAQDYYSHRQFTPGYLAPNQFIPYGPHAGHTPDGDKHCADYVGLRPELAILMAKDSYDHIAQYARTFTGKNATPPDFAALINALCKSYYIPRTYHNYQIDPNFGVKPPSSQEAINHALSFIYTEWLPSYNADKHVLPYDDSNKSLQSVKDMIASWK